MVVATCRLALHALQRAYRGSDLESDVENTGEACEHGGARESRTDLAASRDRWIIRVPAQGDRPQPVWASEQQLRRLSTVVACSFAKKLFTVLVCSQEESRNPHHIS